MKPVLLNQNISNNIIPAEPLWKRVPTRDDDGKLLGDFMMLIPHLNTFSSEKVQDIINRLNKLFCLYQDYIAFADLNFSINVLWISHRQHSGIAIELAAAIHAVVPEAKLVAQHHE
ncbi:MAG: hypothetical protein OEY52_07520 [Gammaproteobacteria bacterium]|nr:hypothetical protein [Gammaproteobacteria bacterium]